jgi:hypothetical protein
MKASIQIPRIQLGSHRQPSEKRFPQAILIESSGKALKNSY